jgi:hypothetical protein|tara:strand:- start:5767 stop:6807 length:1041 start_codon:yes stop_codon:yes gene_type:complete
MKRYIINKICWFFLFIAFQFSPVFTQYVENVSKVGTTSAPFLNIPIGSRATAMGGAFSVIQGDLSCIYWNAAGLSQLQGIKAMAYHSEWIVDTDFDVVVAGISLGNQSTIAASLTSFRTGMMEITTLPEPEGTGEYFQPTDLAIAIAYARNLTDRFSIGATGRVIRRQVWNMISSGMAIDIGTLYDTGYRNTMIAASISNFGGDLKLVGRDVRVKHDIDELILGNNDNISADLSTESWPLPLVFRFGLTIEPIKSESQNLIVAVDAVHPNDNTEYVNIGLEYGFLSTFYLRAGYKSLFLRDNLQGPTFGFGVHRDLFSGIGLDINYSFMTFKFVENVHSFDLVFTF